MKKTLLLSSLFLLLFSFANADSTVSHFLQVRDIVLPQFGSPEYVRIPLDREVASKSTGFRDVRVFSESAQEEVPYQLIVEDESVISAYAPSQTVDTVTDGAGRLMFILDLGQSGILHSRLNIEAGTKNYRRQVSVYGASELLPHESTSWKLLTDQGYIFKFSDETARFSVSEGTVSYPESSVRYVRVVIEGGAEGALRFSSAGVFRYAREVGKETKEEVRAEINQVPGEQATEVLADLGARGVLTKEMTLFVSQKGNFSRPVGISGSNDGEQWVSIGSGYLSQVETVKFTGSNTTLRYPESSYRYYRARIENFDDTPVSLEPRVLFKGTLRTIVFEARPDTSYSLYYGNSSLYAPRYDLARFFDYLDTSSLREGALGAVRENSGYVAPEPPVVPFSDRNKILLNVTLAFLVVMSAVLIFWYLWRARLFHSPSLPAKVSPVEPTKSESDSVEKSQEPTSTV